MSFLTKLRYFNTKTLNGNFIKLTGRFANKKIDPLIEKVKKNKNEKNNSTNDSKIENLHKGNKRFLFSEIISFAIGLGLTAYVIYLIKRKREESKLLDKMNVYKINLNSARYYLYGKK